MHQLILMHPIFWQSREHWDTLVRRRESVCTLRLISSNNSNKILKMRAKSWCMLSKNQELPNTAERGLVKVTPRPEQNVILAMFIYERVFAHGIKKKKKKVIKSCQLFTWISKTRITQ